MVLQVALLGCRVLAKRAVELPRVEVELHVLLVVAAVGRLVLAVGAPKRLGPVVHLPGMPGHLVLVGRQVVAAVALERPFTCLERRHGEESVRVFSTYSSGSQPMCLEARLGVLWNLIHTVLRFAIIDSLYHIIQITALLQHIIILLLLFFLQIMSEFDEPVFVALDFLILI